MKIFISAMHIFVPRFFRNAFQSFEQQVAVAKNNRKMAKNSLRELCMRAVIAHREIFTGITSPSSAHLLENLREFCFYRIYCSWTKISSSHSFAAALVKSDLVKNVLSSSCYYLDDGWSGGIMSDCFSRGAIEFDKWSRFLCRLLDGNLATLHMPRKCTSKESIEKLMVEVGKRCRGLKLFEASIYFDNERFQPFYREDDRIYTWFEPIFCRALPRLVNLQVVQLKYFNCDDKALEQFAIHTKNLM
jgi:hypothetical protein